MCKFFHHYNSITTTDKIDLAGLKEIFYYTKTFQKLIKLTLKQLKINIGL